MANEKDFKSLYYNVTSTNTPSWWPDNAHTSFYYKYNEITKEEIDSLSNKIIKKSTLFSNIKVKKCTGHFLQW